MAKGKKEGRNPLGLVGMEPVSSEDRGERGIGIDAFDALGEKIRETHDFNGLQFLEPLV